MGVYEPYLVGPIVEGLNLGLQPWLLPKDAFSTLTNCYLRRGVLQKRSGYAEFDRFVHAVDDEAIGASGSTNYAGTLAEFPIRAGDLSFTDGTLTITDDSDGTMSGDGSGTIDYTTGDYDITFSGAATGAVTADYDFYPGEAIVGIYDYVTSSGTRDLMVWDTLRLCKYDSGAEKLEDVAGADTWTGDSSNLMWTVNWRNRLFMVNNNDQVRSWNGSALSALTMDIDDDASNDVDTCRMLFVYKERLVALYPTESGAEYPQRARWCKAGDPDDWVDADSGGTGGYVDCPISDVIVSAGFLGDDLIVFFDRSVWKLKYTGNSDLPFRWERMLGDDGSYATFSTVTFASEIHTINQESILSTNGFNTYSIDDKVPDFVLDIDQDIFDYIFAKRVDQYDQVYFSYPSRGASTSNMVLVYNYKEKSFSKFDLAFQCFGDYTEGGGYTIDTHPLGDETLDDLEITFDDRTQAAGYPLLLAGCTSGYVWKLNFGGDDNASAIDLEIETGRWNPYIKEGKKARLGWVDILVDRDPDISLDVDFYVDQESYAYLSETVTFDGDSDTEDKVWKRVYCGGIGEFHRLNISHSASNQTPVIHAIMPWFKPAGKVR